MKALIMGKDLSVKYQEAKKPEIKDGHVIIKVAACGICGTDMHVKKGMPSGWGLPGIIGHELSGTVIQCAKDVTDVQIGENVTIQPLVNCNECEACKQGTTNLCQNMKLIGGEIPGGFAEEVLVPANSVIKLPEGMPVEYGALAEPTATAVHAVDRLKSDSYDSVIIFGAGTIGLITMAVLKDRAETIIVSDIDDSRLETALQQGATHVINAKNDDVVAKALEANDGKKIALIVDAAGFNSTREQGFSLVKPGGEMLFIALGEQFMTTDFTKIVTNELSLYGT